MKGARHLRKSAMEFLYTAYHGLTIDEWYEKLKNKYPDVDKSTIYNKLEYIIKHNWAVQKIIVPQRGIVYVHIDLLL
jgi:Fe2+ or Zn2+ uptake regulation protein